MSSLSDSATSQMESEARGDQTVGESASCRLPFSSLGSKTNVGTNERMLSLFAGSAITLLGLRGRSNFGALLAVAGGAMIYRGSTGHCAMYSAMGTNTAKELPSTSDYFDHGVHVEQVVTIEKSAEELYQFWRHFENLPRFMQHLKSVRILDDKKSHWTARAPAGREVEWDAEIINDEPNKLIAWRSLENADVHSTGSVRFTEAPAHRGTEVRVTLEYLPPAGQIGRWIAKLFGEEPEQQVREDLRHFKQVMEAGEIATTDGQPAAR